MSPVEMAARIIVLILEALGPEIGPALVRKKTDEWEAGRIASNAAFRAKWPGQEP